MDALSPERLSRLLDTPAHAWSADDRAAALRHQLAAPLLPDLIAAPGAPRRIETLATRPNAPHNFAELFTSPSPAPELLAAAKQWARHVRSDPASPLCEGPATVLYFAAIAAALVHHREKITSLSVAELRDGFAWSQDQPGADKLSALLHAALGCVATA